MDPDVRGNMCDLHSFRLIGSADKSRRKGTIGAFGIGFIAVYQITDHPELTTQTVRLTRDETQPRKARIDEGPAPAGANGTTFVLPWARDPDSPFRKQTGLGVVTNEIIDDLSTQLLDLAPIALLFSRNWTQSKSTLRLRDLSASRPCVMPKLSQSATAKPRPRGWRCRERRRSLLNYSAGNLCLPVGPPPYKFAIPIEQPLAKGRLFTYLPTQDFTHVGFHINGDFVPLSNRAHVATAGIEGQWNAAIVESVGGLLGDALEEMVEVLGPTAALGNTVRLVVPQPLGRRVNGRGLVGGTVGPGLQDRSDGVDSAASQWNVGSASGLLVPVCRHRR